MSNLNNVFIKNDFTSFTKSPFVARNTEKEDEKVYAPWGWRFRHLYHLWQDRLGVASDKSTNSNNDILYQDSEIVDGALGGPYGGLYANINTLRNSILDDFITYMIQSDDLQGGPFCKNEVPSGVSWPYRRSVAIQLDTTTSDPDLTEKRIEAILEYVHEISGIEVGGIDLVTGYRTWSNCLPDNSIEYTRWMDGTHKLEDPDILSNGAIAFDELELVLKTIYKYFLDYDDDYQMDANVSDPESYERGSSGVIFEISGIVCPAWETESEAWANRKSCNGWYLTGGGSCGDGPEFDTENPVLFSSEIIFGNWRICSPFSPYLDRYNSQYYTGKRTHYTRSNGNYNRHYIRYISAKYYLRCKKISDDAGFNAFGSPAVQDAFSLWESPPATQDRSIQTARINPIIASTIIASYQNKSKQDGFQLDSILTVVYPNMETIPALIQHDQKKAEGCPYCNYLALTAVSNPRPYMEYEKTENRPYGYTEWATPQITTFQLYCWTGTGGIAEIYYTSNCTTDPSVDFSIPIGSGEGIEPEEIFEFKIILDYEPLPDADTLPSDIVNAQVDIRAKESIWPLSLLRLRAEYYVQASSLVVTPDEIDRTDDISDVEIDIISSSNYGRINYSVILTDDTFFSVDKLSDDVTYTGSTIDSKITVSFSSGLPPGTYNGNIELTFVGANISTKDIPIQLVITV